MNLLTLSLAALAASLGVTDRALGTWRLNVAKSSFIDEAPRSETWHNEVISGWLRSTLTTVAAGGRTKILSYRFKVDGQEYPVQGDPKIQTVSGVQLDPLTLEMQFRSANTEVLRIRKEFSPDGRTFHSTTTFRNAKGNKTTTSATYERVEPSKRASKNFLTGFPGRSRLANM